MVLGCCADIPLEGSQGCRVTIIYFAALPGPPEITSALGLLHWPSCLSRPPGHDWKPFLVCVHDFWSHSGSVLNLGKAQGMGCGSPYTPKYLLEKTGSCGPEPEVTSSCVSWKPSEVQSGIHEWCNPQMLSPRIRRAHCSTSTI